MAEGWCTLEDVRRALRKAELPGDVSQDKRIAVDAIVSQTEWLEKKLDRYWYANSGDDIVSEASKVTIPQSPTTRDDEEDIPTHGAAVHGASETDRHRQIRIAIGNATSLEPPIDDTIPAYTRIRLARKDVDAINTLNVINEDGGYDDWVSSNDYSGGVGNSHRGGDYWARVNNGGVSELYLDVHAMDDDIASFAKAVYIDYDYGHEGIPRNVRRAVANFAGADLVEEAVIEIPQNATIYNIQTKADEMREQADKLLEEYR